MTAIAMVKPQVREVEAAREAPRPARKLNEDACWQATQERRQSARDLFIIAVRTTRIYCRPGCPSRMPKRENVRFFVTPDEAEAAGFRACKRCKPRDPARADVMLVQRIARDLERASATPTLAT